jgi:hypothetical protein
MKWADLTATNGQFSWPPAGSFVTAYGHFSMAADITARCRDQVVPKTSACGTAKVQAGILVDFTRRLPAGNARQ